MNGDYLQVSFEGGMIPSSLGGRIDLPEYQMGAETIINATITPQGSLKRRPGFKRIYEGEAGSGEIDIASMYTTGVESVLGRSLVIASAGNKGVLLDGESGEVQTGIAADFFTRENNLPSKRNARIIKTIVNSVWMLTKGTVKDIGSTFVTNVSVNITKQHPLQLNPFVGSVTGTVTNQTNYGNPPGTVMVALNGTLTRNRTSWIDVMELVNVIVPITPNSASGIPAWVEVPVKVYNAGNGQLSYQYSGTFYYSGMDHPTYGPQTVIGSITFTTSNSTGAAIPGVGDVANFTEYSAGQGPVNTGIADITTSYGRTWILTESMKLYGSTPTDPKDFTSTKGGVMLTVAARDGLPTFLQPVRQGILIGTTKGEWLFSFRPDNAAYSTITQVSSVGSSERNRSVQILSTVYFVGTDNATLYGMAYSDERGGMVPFAVASIDEYEILRGYEISDIECVPGKAPIIAMLCKNNENGDLKLAIVHVSKFNPMTVWTIPNSAGECSLAQVYADGGWHLGLATRELKPTTTPGGEATTVPVMRIYRTSLDMSYDGVEGGEKIIFPTTFMSLPIEIQTETGPSIFQKKSMRKLLVRLRRTGGIRIGSSPTNTQELSGFALPLDPLATEEMNGDYEIFPSQDTSRDVRVYWEAVNDLPLEVLMFRVGVDANKL